MMNRDLDRAQTAIDAVLVSMSAAAHTKAEAYRQKFRFSLAIGNAAGVVYSLTMMTNANPILPWWHVLPSAWLFVAGAGLGSAMLLASSKAEEGRWATLSGAQIIDHADTVDQANAQLKVENAESRMEEALAIQKDGQKATERYSRLSLGLEVSAAAAFIAGVVYPLVILTARALA